MYGRQVVRRRPQARKMRRFETERPTVRAIVREGTDWAGLHWQRLPGLALALSCLVLIVFLFSDPRFFVYSSEVTGCALVPAANIYEASGADTSSIFFVAPGEVRRRLLERFPGLEEARVAVGLPAVLRIRVVERQVRFVWEAEGQTWLADAKGVILGRGSSPGGMLYIRCTEGCTAAAGQQLDPAVLEAVASLSRLLGGRLQFEYSLGHGVSWRSEQGWPVYFGTGADLPLKVAVMQSMLADLEANGIQPQFLDVSVPSRPFYR